MADAAINNTPAATAAPNDDLAGLTSRYRRYVPMVLGIAALFVVAALVFSLVFPKSYTATATVLYSPQRALVTPSNESTTAPDTVRDSTVDTQSEAMRSLPLAAVAVQQYHLDQDPLIVKKAKAEANNPIVTHQDFEDAVSGVILDKTRARRIGQTDLFEISYTDHDPIRAANVTNALANAYLQQQVQQKQQVNLAASAMLNSRIGALRQQVEAAEAAVEDYKAKHNLMSAQGSTMAEQEISSLSQQLALMRAEQAETTGRYLSAQQQLQSGSNGEDVGAALESPVVSELRRQRAEVSRRVAELQSQYGPRYPDLVNAKKELADVDAQIHEEITRILSNLKAETDVSQQRTSSIEASLNAARNDLASGGQASVELNELERNADAARTLYESFLTRAKETEAQQAVAQPDSQITAPASPPIQPSFPNLPIDLFLGAVLGLGVGAGAAFVRHRWTVGLATFEDVERQLGQACVGSIPTMATSVDKAKTTNPIDAVIDHPLSGFAEAFRNLGASLLYSAGAPGAVKVLAISSALPREGKTTTSICLARVLAMGGSRVVLLDCDLRRRSVTEALKPDASVGLIEVLEGSKSLSEGMLLDERSGAYFLPLGLDAHMAKSPFESEAMDNLLAHLRSHFDVVILDTAPILAVVDTRVLAQKVDALAMLVRWRTTPTKAVRAALQLVESVGGTVTGIALSLVNLNAQAQSGYGDPSSYYRQVKSYYTR